MSVPTQFTPTQERKGTEYIPAMLAFIEKIGIPTRMEKIDSETFVPGLKIENGVLFIDMEKMLYPGDLLHEAGHIAVTPGNTRATFGQDITEAGEEIVTLLWSYAALKEIGIPEEIVFHPMGYKGQSDWLIENFRDANYIGLPLLEWMGLTASEKKAKELNIPPFPNMIRWLRE
ncbi:MAG TPA: hypothetical protein VFJ43_10810 [Bacteroidia bacterium]|nr:hypothetical protein [Bacteroidia bacterium]